MDAYQSVLGRLGAERWVDFEARCERGSASGLVAAMLVACRERRSKSGNKFAFAAFSDMSGQFEAVLFSDVLSASRSLLESGRPLLLGLGAEREGETVKVRVQSIESLDKAAAGVQKGLRIVLEDRASLPRIRDMLAEKGRGEIRVVLQLDHGMRELEVRLPGRFDISPQRASALMGLSGVVAVQDL